MPNFSSATTYFKEGGIELKEITIKQQETLETNTLDLIEHEKSIKALQSENEALKSENAALKTRLAKIEAHLGLDK